MQKMLYGRQKVKSTIEVYNNYYGGHMWVFRFPIHDQEYRFCLLLVAPKPKHQSSKYVRLSEKEGTQNRCRPFLLSNRRKRRCEKISLHVYSVNDVEDNTRRTHVTRG